MAGRGPVKRSNQTEKKTIGIGGPRLGLPTGPAQRAPLNRYEGKQFGQVVSVNAGFGFLQPYGEKEQAYYSQRDAPAGLELGAEVAFLLQRGARGLSASAIQTVSPDAIVTKAAQRGIVAQAAEGLRCPVGHIRVSGSGDETDTSDSFAVYVEGEGGAWRQPLAVGDEVEFTLGIIPETTYKRATNTTLIQMRKDRKKNEKIKALIAAGAEQEQGIVESIVKVSIALRVSPPSLMCCRCRREETTALSSVQTARASFTSRFQM